MDRIGLLDVHAPESVVHKTMSHDDQVVRQSASSPPVTPIAIDPNDVVAGWIVGAEAKKKTAEFLAARRQINEIVGRDDAKVLADFINAFGSGWRRGWPQLR